MRLSCKNSTLLFLLIASTWSNRISAEQIDTSTASSEDVSLEHSLASSVGSSENIHANLGPYEQAIELLESLPKDREVFKKPKFTSHGLFQSQFQRLSTFLYNQLFSSEKSKDSQVKAKHPKIQQATALLEREAKLGNSDAIFTLAELNFFSYYGYPRNLKLAFDYYSQLASEKGNATAQRMVSLMYATGIGHVVERDQGKALLYSTFASLGQDTAAQMMVGYRHLKGIGTSSSCDEAVWYYKKVADKAMEQYKSGPPGGRVLPLPKVLLPEENGGIYGYAHNGGSGHRDQSEVEDILQYTRQLAEGGSIEAQLTLGYIYYRGSRFVRRNHKDAYRYFLSVASHMYNNNRVKDIKDPEEISFIGQACGMLGEMYRRGEGVPPDYDIALKWYSRGVEKENPISLNGLGVMYLEGIVVTKNIQRAQEYFELASKLKNPEAQVNLGLLYLNAPDPDYNSAIILFTEAYQAKYFPASYYLAEMYNRGLGVTKSCFAAVTLYKIISERGDWLHSPFPKAHNAYKKGDIETAFLWYLMGAEMGYEVGQTNVAWLLDEDRYELIEQSPNLIPDDLPLIYWTRSANQGQSDSRVKMGDYYYYGIGAEVNLEKAASCYEVAANDESNALGMWNMGWMHENGIGVSKVGLFHSFRKPTFLSFVYWNSRISI
ncbi:ERAD-associated protein, variant 2 [Basidiobolus ranarum]|uniref:ERAD-associated protein, variant 2 n=1 Tax=Basidiobolus ranarum TaxID=34480 RepID=A0ABR2WXJ1_9FUNG